MKLRQSKKKFRGNDSSFIVQRDCVSTEEFKRQFELVMRKNNSEVEIRDGTSLKFHVSEGFELEFRAVLYYTNILLKFSSQVVKLKAKLEL